MIEAKILKGKTLKEEGVVIKIEAGDVVTTHNKGNNKHILKITSHLKVHILIMAPLPMPPQNMIQPPPYDPNWQLRQTQFYNSPSVTGQYGQNQYSQGQQQQVPYNRDRQNPRTSKQAQHICELCGNRPL